MGGIFVFFPQRTPKVQEKVARIALCECDFILRFMEKDWHLNVVPLQPPKYFFFCFTA